jgi:hypothetical protein
MYVNWQFPHSLAEGLKCAPMSATEVAAREAEAVMPAPRPALRDRIDYWFIVSVCLPFFIWVGLIERCNPLYWSARRGNAEGSLWSISKRNAHHCATLAFLG